MKKRFQILSIAPLCLALTFASCGGDSTEPVTTDSNTDTTKAELPAGPDFETVCATETNLSVSVQDYYFGGEGKVFNYTPAAFNITSSSWKMVNDSIGTINLSNFTDEEATAGMKDEHATIKIEFATRKGNKFSPGTYKDGNFEPFAATTTIITNKGTTYFNWVSGMPEVGAVTINFVDAEHICGEINLSSDDKTVKYIGTVKVSGTFKI